MKIYHVETQQAYNELMTELEEKGCKWKGGEKPTNFHIFKRYGKNTYIYDEYGVIQVSSGEYFKEHYSNEPVIKYETKGENMLNTECKQCHKKRHHDNAKYCSMCGKKLVDEPKFKVGDYVVQYDNYITKIDEIDEYGYLIGRTYEVDVQTLEIPKNYIVSKTARIARPSEIAEYEAALQFHKHGREPFEVKEGDLIKYPNGQNIMIYHPDCFSKTDFLNDGFKLLKTAEEVNEWLESK